MFAGAWPVRTQLLSSPYTVSRFSTFQLRRLRAHRRDAGLHTRRLPAVLHHAALPNHRQGLPRVREWQLPPSQIERVDRARLDPTVPILPGLHRRPPAPLPQSSPASVSERHAVRTAAGFLHTLQGKT